MPRILRCVKTVNKHEITLTGLNEMVNAYICYKTMDPIVDFFKNVKLITCDDMALTGSQWSTILTNECNKSYKDASNSCFYIPLPVSVCKVCKLEMNGDEYGERISCVYGAKPPCKTRRYSLEKSVLVSHGQTELTIDIMGHTTNQVVWHFGAPNAVTSASIYSNNLVVWDCENAYESIVIDKLVNGLPLPAAMVFTSTIEVTGDLRLVVKFNGELVPDGSKFSYYVSY